MRAVDDLTRAIRSLSRGKATTGVLLVSLALGTGANAALVSITYALLFHPPAGVQAGSRLVSIGTSQFNGAAHGLTSYPDFEAVAAEASTMDEVAAYDDATVEMVRIGAAAHHVRVVAVSGRYFPTLGMRAHSGRLLDERDAARSPPAAVLGYPLWTALGAPSDVIGGTLHVGSREYLVVGIAPPRFAGLQIGRASGVWVPLAADDGLGDRGDRRLSVVGRLRDGIQIAAADADVRAVSERLAAAFPATNRGTRSSADEPRRMTAVAYTRLNPAERERFALLGAAVVGATALLLAGACVNAAAMLLSRSGARRRELAVKLALGANRRQLVRQALAEGLCISIGGAALGLLLARWTTAALPALFAPEEAEMLPGALDTTVVLVTVGFSTAAGLFFSAGPARHATHTLDIDVLRADAGGIAERGGTPPVRAAIVVGQVALSTVMVIAAGLLQAAFGAALEGDLGRTGDRIAVAVLRLPGSLSGDVARGIAFHTRAMEVVRRLPGVEAAGWVTSLPVGRATFRQLQVEAGPSLMERADVEVNVASEGYFRTLRIPVLEGRSFTRQDSALARPVIVVNDVLARRYIGARAAGAVVRDEDGTAYEVVGVVGSGKYRALQDDPGPMVFFAHAQRRQDVLHLVVRTSGDAESMLTDIAERLASVDPSVDPRLMTFRQHLQQALSLDRLTTTAVSACSLAALVLATLGVYGVIGDGVRRRTPEIGLRIALGAGRLQVVRLVLGEGLHLTLAGAVVGLGAAVLLSRVAGAWVHGLPAIDLGVLVLLPLALTLVVSAAALVPARRALRISPTVALRAD